MQSSNASPFPRSIFYAITVLAVAALAWWVLLPKNEVVPRTAEPANLSNAIQQLENDPKIAEPFQKVHITPVVCTIKVDADTVLALSGGTSIEIPAGIFVNDHNEPILSPVEIQFREFHSAADVITSGIPMEAVPGNGRDDCFETAGMFEIKGYADGRPIKIAEGKSMTVNLRSNAPGNYDFWKYDPQSGAWINQAPGSKVDTRPAKSAPSPGDDNNRFARLSMQAPTAPANLETDARTPLQFKGLNMDVSKCANLRNKKTQTILLYAGKNVRATEPKILKQISQFRWRKSTLTPTADPNLYTLVMEGDTTLRFPVTLALSGPEYQTQQKAYEALMAEYSQGAGRREYMEKLEAQQEAVTRGMAIQGFGLYNHDRFYSQPDVMQVAGDFDFGETLSADVRAKIIVYLIAGKDRAIIQYPAHYWKEIRFSQSDRNSLVAVLPDGRVATFAQSDFERVRSEMASTKGQPYLFKMTLQPKPVASVEDLQQTIQRIAI